MAKKEEEVIRKMRTDCGMHGHHAHARCCGPVMGHTYMGHPSMGCSPGEMTLEEESETLKRHKEMLAKRLEQIEKRLEEISE